MWKKGDPGEGIADIEGNFGAPKWVQKYKCDKVKRLPIFAQVYDMLLDGTPAMQVAKFIQSAGFHEDQSIHTVRGWVEHFNATIPKALVVKRQNPIQYHRAKAQVDKAIDVIGELRELLDLQKKRINMGHDREEQMQFLMNNMHKEMNTALEYLKVAHTVKDSLGLNRPQHEEPIETEGRVLDLEKTYAREGLNKVLDNPKSRMKVLSTVERYVEMYGKRDVQRTSVHKKVEPNQQDSHSDDEDSPSELTAEKEDPADSAPLIELKANEIPGNPPPPPASSTQPKPTVQNAQPPVQSAQPPARRRRRRPG